MKTKKKRWCALLLSGVFCFTTLTGCGSEEKSPSPEKNVEQKQQEEQVDPETVEHGTYKPSMLVIPSQEEYEYPYMGLNFSLPKSLRERMDNQEVAMLDSGGMTEDETTLSYAVIKWKTMTKEQRDMEVESGGNEFYDWADGLEAIGAIGVYQADAAKDIDKLTNCTSHKEIGKSKDGSYIYYLSVNSDADSELQEEVNSISYEITEMGSVDEELSSEGTETAAGATVGEFSTEDIQGEAYTQEMFADYDLTMVNVFTTWCSPCVNEIPDLETLHKEMADQGVNVVGIVLDVIDGSGSTDSEVIEKAKILAERTGATYPFLIPDKGNLNGRLSGINAVPETFFVDKEGNLVGETYSGSHSLDEWKSIVEKELKEVTK